MNLESNHDMDEIIDNLYLGSFEGAQNIYKIKDLGIKKVLSILDLFWPEYKEPDNITHKKLTIPDIGRKNIIKYFGECFDFIKGEDKVLVHCSQGASRSATIVIAYLMWSKKMPYKEALEFVKKKRSIVWPNFGFKDQLELFEKELIDKNYDIDKIKFEEIKWDPNN